jgi:phospholipase C
MATAKTPSLNASSLPLSTAGSLQSALEAISYILTPNEYEGTTQTITVDGGDSSVVSWPTDDYGYYDVIITANTADGFTRRYAGRIA